VAAGECRWDDVGVTDRPPTTPPETASVEIAVSEPMLAELMWGMPFSGVLQVERWGDRWVLVFHNAADA
jgi:hypothetical protein